MTSEQPGPAPIAPDAPDAPGRLEALLDAGTFAVTAEVTPPLSAAAEDLLVRARPLLGVADAVNLTDGAGARAHMCSLAAAALVSAEGLEPVLQLTTRDRNRIALQSDLLGAAALGVRNILCLTGDDVAAGDQPEAKMVFDLDSAGLMAMAHAMATEARLPSGRTIDTPPRLFIGAADTPREPDAAWSADGIRRKIAAGARFFQTQFCFDPGLAARYAARLADEGVTERAGFLIGVGPVRSAKSARWMNAHLYGVEVPDAVIARLEAARDQEEEGIRICAELIAALAETPAVAGVHVMGIHANDAVAEAVRRSGVLDRRARPDRAAKP